MIIRGFERKDLDEALEIWNSIVREGNAFPQEEELNPDTGLEFFKSQSHTGVCVKKGKVQGLYILHPNNVGRCSHIANASYGVSAESRGHHIGEKLVLDSIEKAR